MMTFEDFCERNRSWNNFSGSLDLHDMRKNFVIALQAHDTFYKNYNFASDKPQVGDIVECSDGYKVYHNALVESVDKYGNVEICYNGSSHIWFDKNDFGFSTSGGPFTHKHASKFERKGIGYRTVWTWGCFGAGYNQGVYFRLPVRKWLIPYGELKSEFVVSFRSKLYAEKNCASRICIRDYDWVWFGFKSYRAYKAFADYIGFDYDHNNLQSFRWGRGCKYRFTKQYISSMSDAPTDAKKLVLCSNGRLCYKFIHKDGNLFTVYDPVKELREELLLPDDQETRDKYFDNPMGV